MAKLKKQIELIERIDRLIRLKATGSPKILAQKCHISEASLYRLIETIRELGAPVKFSHMHGSYIYTNDVNFLCGFFTRELSKKESKRVNGGLNELNLNGKKINSLLEAFINFHFFFIEIPYSQKLRVSRLNLDTSIKISQRLNLVKICGADSAIIQY